ncbi:MAG TPA: hypothetical protein ACFYD8_05480 [Candidatus Wujingus californicus]|uniref:hypothetical protein n=1 Tax=Candidatus Wujingus californicus TaxID=3367618 RepID=UPI00402665FD
MIPSRTFNTVNIPPISLDLHYANSLVFLCESNFTWYNAGGEPPPTAGAQWTL